MASRAAAARTSTPPPGGVVIQNFNDPNTPETPATEAPTFWERIYGITPDQWSQYICYLYRGKESLTKINHPFDPEWVQQNFGGGDYRAILNDEKYKLVASHSFSIAGPPRVVNSSVQASAPAPANDAFQSQVLQLIAENNREMREMIKDAIQSVRTQSAAPAAAGGSELDRIAIKGVVDMFTAMMPKQQNPLELLASLKTFLQPAQPQTDLLAIIGKLKELGIVGTTPAGGGDLASQVDSLLSVSEKLGLRGGGKDGGIGQILAEKAPEIMDKVGGIVQNWAKISEANRAVEQMRFERARVVPVVQAPTLPGNAAAVTHPAAGSVAGLEVEPIGTGTATQPGAQFVSSQPGGTATMPGAMPAAAAPVPGVAVDEIDRMKQKIVEAIARGKTGADIISFMDVVDDRLVDSFQGVTAPQLVEFFTMDPILNAATKLPRFTGVIQEIVEELNAVADDEPEPAQA